MANGERLVVPHEDFIWIMPNRRIVQVALPNGASRRVNWDGRETWDGQNTGDAAMKQIATARRVRFAAAATQGARRCASAWCR